MGSCASRHEVLKNAGEAPLPAPANDHQAEVIKEEIIIVSGKKEGVLPPAGDEGDEAKPQPLGKLFDESKEEKSSSESKFEHVMKQEEVISLKSADQVNEKENNEASNSKTETPKTDTKELAKTDGPQEIDKTEYKEEANSEALQETEEMATAKTEALEKNKSQSGEEKPIEEKKTEENKSEEEKRVEESETSSTEAKTSNEKKTTGSDEKKPMFKLWF